MEDEEKPFLNAIQQQMRENGMENAESIVFRNFAITSRSMKVRMREDNPEKYAEITGTAVIASENPVQREVWISGEGYRKIDEILIMSGLSSERLNILPLLMDFDEAAVTGV